MIGLWGGAGRRGECAIVTAAAMVARDMPVSGPQPDTANRQCRGRRLLLIALLSVPVVSTRAIEAAWAAA
jgi:hypothetical protein